MGLDYMKLLYQLLILITYLILLQDDIICQYFAISRYFYQTRKILYNIIVK